VNTAEHFWPEAALRILYFCSDFHRSGLRIDGIGNPHHPTFKSFTRVSN
jgi:hypothetical protein